MAEIEKTSTEIKNRSVRLDDEFKLYLRSMRGKFVEELKAQKYTDGYLQNFVEIVKGIDTCLFIDYSISLENEI